MLENEDTFTFALAGIKTEQFAILVTSYNHKKEVKINQVVHFKIELEKRIIGVFITLDFVQSKKVLLKLATSCHFLIEENSWSKLLNKEKTELDIPKHIIHNFLHLSYGTTRGILHSKLEGSIFANLLLPFIDVNLLAPNDIVFVLEKPNA